MSALKRSGVNSFDRIATFALNHYRHLELYFAIPCIQGILHTLNIRLFPEQFEFIVNHAEDKYIFIDKSLTRVIAPLIEKFKTVEKFIIMDDKENIEPAQLPNAIDYEEFLSKGDYEEGWNLLHFLKIDKNDPAGMCYTSGTTGNPKGVLYSHRTIFLHSMGISLADALCLSENETVLPVVPMFHANAWGIPFACVMTGAKLVFPGKHLLGHPLAELLEKEEVTIAAGVPTVWNVLYQQLKKKQYHLKLHTMVVGGSAAPRSMIENYEKEFGINILHAWGMTETSPLGTVSRLRSYMKNWDKEKQYQMRVKQGFAVPGIEIRAIDDNGNDIPRDGKSVGELIVRGAWVTGSYYKMDIQESFTQDGWFRTGDVVTIDEYNFMQITDRKKDLIKTRGE
jgi:fatty-acyl-CoA synthase